MNNKNTERVKHRIDRDKLINDLSTVSDGVKELILKNPSSKSFLDGSFTEESFERERSRESMESDHRARDIAQSEEIPCFDIVPPEDKDAMRLLKCCVAKRLHKECAKALLGPWTDPANVDITQIGGGLSNYLFCGSLKPGCVVQNDNCPKKVLIRVYGEVLRDNADFVVLESIIFALLSEKKLGPKLHSIFPCGRIEQYIDSRPLRPTELYMPLVSEWLAKKLARIHKLQMPLDKNPDYIMKALSRYINQLSDYSTLPKRTSSWSSITDLTVEFNHEASSAGCSTMNGACNLSENNPHHQTVIPFKRDLRSQGPDRDENMNEKPTKKIQGLAHRKSSVIQNVSNPLLARCEKCSNTNDLHRPCPSPENEAIKEPEERLKIRVGKLFKEYHILEEFEWLNERLDKKFADKFPVTFCHNDVQENNILLVPDQNELGKLRLLPIDYEYCSYNFRGFDIGNHFNEWCFEYADDLNEDGFLTTAANYPNSEQQLTFMYHYLAAFYSNHAINCGEDNCCYLKYDPTDQDEYANQPIKIPADLNRLKNLRIEGSFQEGCLKRDQLPLTAWENEPRNLLLEIYYGALTSHLFWGVWSLIQTLISNIDFNFLEYAEVRFRLYHRMKESYQAMEAHLNE